MGAGHPHLRVHRGRGGHSGGGGDRLRAFGRLRAADLDSDANAALVAAVERGGEGRLHVLTQLLGGCPRRTRGRGAERDRLPLVCGDDLAGVGVGTDLLTGGAGSDHFYFGDGRFNAGDRVDGRGGTLRPDEGGMEGPDLSRAGLACAIVELPGAARTARAAAEYLGCEVGQIANSLVFRAEASNRAVLVMSSGAKRVDLARLAALVGEPVGKADADFVRRETGFAIGGVPPVGHDLAHTFVEKSLAGHRELWAAAGHPHAPAAGVVPP